MSRPVASRHSTPQSTYERWLRGVQGAAAASRDTFATGASRRLALYREMYAEGSISLDMFDTLAEKCIRDGA